MAAYILGMNYSISNLTCEIKEIAKMSLITDDWFHSTNKNDNDDDDHDEDDVNDDYD